MSTKKDVLVSEDLTALNPPTPLYQLNTWLTYSPDEAHVYEPCFGPSETVPDMTIPLELMLERTQSGIPVPTRQDGYSDEDYPDIFKMDEFELAMFRESLAEQMTEMQDQLHIASKALEEKEELARKNAVTKQQEETDKKSEKEPVKKGDPA